jgi:phospholipid/cholesterol/gamma-HCH transport system substrate-binding protein
MQASPVRDLVVGLFVFAGLASLAYLTFRVGGVTYEGRGGLVLYAAFEDIGGLKARAPVSISGVKVGRVDGVELDPMMRAKVRLELDADLALPIDSSARILTSGVLGDQFVSLEPGAEEDILESGDEIQFTESALSLERLVGKFVNDAGLEEGKEE